MITGSSSTVFPESFDTSTEPPALSSQIAVVEDDSTSGIAHLRVRIKSGCLDGLPCGNGFRGGAAAVATGARGPGSSFLSAYPIESASGGRRFKEVDAVLCVAAGSEMGM